MKDNLELQLRCLSRQTHLTSLLIKNLEIVDSFLQELSVCLPSLKLLQKVSHLKHPSEELKEDSLVSEPVRLKKAEPLPGILKNLRGQFLLAILARALRMAYFPLFSNKGKRLCNVLLL